MHYSEREGIGTQDVQPGGQSWWEQEAGPRQPRLLGEQRASVPPLPDLLHLLFPISQGHTPAGMVTSHGSPHHSTGPGPATTLPELHNPYHPPVSSSVQQVANPRWTHQATLSVHRLPSSISTLSRAPQQHRRGAGSPACTVPLTLSRLKNKIQNLQTSLDFHPEAQCQPDLLVPTPITPEAELWVAPCTPQPTDLAAIVSPCLLQSPSA